LPKAYWLSVYRNITDPEALARYAKLAGPALEGAGGRFLARGMPSKVLEAGLEQRTVVLEFESVETAVAAYESPAYREALRALGQGAERDIRIIPGTD
jgi:uncharacterized protein (DUF1330 family)